MSHKGEVFSESFTQKENLVTGIEARTKIAFIAVALLINLLSPTIYTPMGIAFFCLATLLTIKIPPKLLLLRIAMPLVMAVVVLVTQIFFYGKTPLFTISFWEWHLIGYEDGLAHGLLIMFRVVGGVSLILLLSLSTPTNKLFLAASWFRVPKIFIELTLLVYRYIFVLIEEVVAIRDAQKVRLGYHNWHQSIRSLGVLGGSLILRAYDRAGRVYEAMSARGYRGSLPIEYTEPFSRKDLVTVICLSPVLVIFFFLGRLSI
jgi:cobalt/nickel transport system permease protein